MSLSFLHLLSVSCLLAIGSLCAGSASPPIVQFHFEQGQCRNANGGAFTDTATVGDGSAAPLVGSLSPAGGDSFTCLPGIGIKGAAQAEAGGSSSSIMLTSSQPLSNLQEYLTTTDPLVDGISFSLWLQPDEASVGGDAEATVVPSQPIFTIGMPVSVGADLPSPPDECASHANLQLRQVGQDLEVEYKTIHHRIPCNPKSMQNFGPLANGGTGGRNILHLAVSLASGNQAVYINGQPVAEINDALIFPFDPTLSHWDGTFQMQFFSDAYASMTGGNSTVVMPWGGSLYSFAIYQTALNDTEVLQLYETPDLPPVIAPAAVDVNVAVAEDTNVTFHLSVYNFYYELLGAAPTNNSTLFIHSLPEYGELFQTDGTLIAQPGTAVNDSGNSTLLYRPPVDFGSATVSFEYYSRSGLDGLDSPSSPNEAELATVTIQIGEVNDPPVAISSRVSVPAGINHTTTILLSGNDIEDDSQDLWAYITAFPEHGTLHLIEADGSYGEELSTSMEGTGVLVETSRIGYFYTGLEVPLDDTGLVGSDAIRFRVKDTHGALSVSEGTISIGVSTSLLAEASSSLAETTALEHNVSGSQIIVRGRDDSGRKRPIGVQILAPPQHGWLYAEPSSLSAPLVFGSFAIGSSDSFPYDRGVTLYYEGNEGFFTSPWTAKASESVDEEPFEEYFSYRTVVFDEMSGSLIGASLPVRQNVIVRNVNDEPTLMLPEETFQVRAFSTLEYDEEFCRADIDYDDVARQCSCRLVVDGIAVEDPDHDLEHVRVDIISSSGNGMVSLNASALPLADFTSCANRSGDWQCRGSGYGDSSMTFLAKPGDLGQILSGLSYESFHLGRDNITITLYDGVGGDCLTEKEHADKSSVLPMPTLLLDGDGNNELNFRYATSYHNGCNVVSGSISVEVMKGAGVSRRAGGDNRLFVTTIPLELWVAIGLGMILLVVMVQNFLRCDKKKKRIFAICSSSSPKEKKEGREGKEGSTST